MGGRNGRRKERREEAMYGWKKGGRKEMREEQWMEEGRKGCHLTVKAGGGHFLIKKTYINQRPLTRLSSGAAFSGTSRGTMILFTLPPSRLFPMVAPFS